MIEFERTQMIFLSNKYHYKTVTCNGSLMVHWKLIWAHRQLIHGF